MSRAILAGLLLVFGWSPAAPAQQPIAARGALALRFHHLHYGVSDPAGAIARVAEATGGTRLLVPGLGPGVRIGNEYVLFDRLVEAASVGQDAAAVEASYAATTRWLLRRGIQVTESATGGAKLAASVGPGRLDHVGLVADDFDKAIRALEEAGAAPLRRSADAALFKVPDGLRIELVKDTEGPEAFWCSMHPDIRSSAPGRCPVCTMELVPIPPLKVGEYRMDVALLPSSVKGGASGVRLAIRDPETGDPVRSLITVHERVLHLFVIGRDLQYFAHLHPEAVGHGVFEVTSEIPPGAYMLAADFLPASGVSQMLQRAVVTPGFDGPLFTTPLAPAPTPAELTVDGVRIAMEARDLAAGKYATVRFSLAEAATGAPLTDLEPFLGAPAHLLVVSADLVDVSHGHPEADRPPMTFEPLLPRAGAYKMWLQFQRNGRVATGSFAVVVR